MSASEPTCLSYKDSGVDIDRAAALIERIKPLARATTRPGAVGGLGGYGALFSLAPLQYRRPLLVSSTDGVGTKLKLAFDLRRHDSIGVDLVAMCVNDVVVQGAEPLFFLDYFATGRLEVDTAAEVIAGIAQGCRLAGTALVGGETAEMPDLYRDGEYDVAGFCVGVVEEDRVLDGTAVRPGDVVLGLASSGPHANGYSLIRRVLRDSGADLNQPFAGQTLGEVLLAPTRIYVRALLRLLREVEVHSLAHITGGGFIDNLPRVIPAGLRTVIHTAAWPRPAIFDWVREHGRIAPREMLRTFNCGIGMAVIVPRQAASAAQALLTEQGETVYEIGYIDARPGSAEAVEIIE
ncbi:MAG: phosphoribosylformylglycinamidine cyclo-ligase [Gammaproteobacteria bacterium]